MKEKVRPILLNFHSQIQNQIQIQKKCITLLKCFTDLVQLDMKEIKTKKVKNPKFNLSNGENLPNEGTVAITTPIICQLSGKNYYKLLYVDLTLQHNQMVNNMLDQFKGKNLLFKKTAEILKMINPKTPKFYIIPKIHKESSMKCHSSEIPHFVDHHL